MKPEFYSLATPDKGHVTVADVTLSGHEVFHMIKAVAPGRPEGPRITAPEGRTDIFTYNLGQLAAAYSAEGDPSSVILNGVSPEDAYEYARTLNEAAEDSPEDPTRQLAYGFRDLYWKLSVQNTPGEQ